MYEKFFKRFLDFWLSLIALILLSPFLFIFTIIGAIVMKGNPFFVQPRPGKIGKDGRERIFKLLKLRSMSNKRDKNGELLPDYQRLGKYGKWLRSTSIDEIPSLINILIGNLSFVGPRPQLVRDLVFMNLEQRKRHTVRPGLTGLAQVNGRNSISWEEKFEYDLKYISNGITLLSDLKIIFKTIGKIIIKEGINEEGKATAEDLGDYLLKKGEVDIDLYKKKMSEAKEILNLR